MKSNMTENKHARGAYRPKLQIFHPNAKGTGCAVTMELHPAHDDVDGSIFLSAANQLTIGDRTAEVPVFPRFDWENKMTVRLCFSDLCQMMQVFRGECESINDGKGLFHSTSGFSTRILLRHLIEPVAGYSLEISRTPVNPGGCEQRSKIFFSAAEAGGISDSIAGSMALISFGMPMSTGCAATEGRTGRIQRGNDAAA